MTTPSTPPKLASTRGNEKDDTEFVARVVAIEAHEEATSITPAEHELTHDAVAGFAADSVFTIPELLENIISNLPQFDIFVVQRVSTTFNNTIQGSKMLQRRMFTAPLSLVDQRGNETVRASGKKPILTSSNLQNVTIGKPLATVLQYRAQGYLQLDPFCSFQTSFSPSNDMHCCSGSEQGQTMGWQGKKAVHATGSWGKIALGNLKRSAGLTICCAGASGEAHQIPVNSTLFDLLCSLRGIRVWVAKATLKRCNSPSYQTMCLPEEVFEERRIAEEVLSMEEF